VFVSDDVVVAVGVAGIGVVVVLVDIIVVDVVVTVVVGVEVVLVDIICVMDKGGSVQVFLTQDPSQQHMPSRRHSSFWYNDDSCSQQPHSLAPMLILSQKAGNPSVHLLYEHVLGSVTLLPTGSPSQH